MDRSACVFVAGGETLIGSALVRQLRHRGFTRVVEMPADPSALTDPDLVEAFFARARPEYVILAGGKSGGIGVNRRLPAVLMRDHLLRECHVLDAAHRHGVKKLLFLASSCCYPRECPQPMRVESLLTGPLEPTSEAYALAKLAGIGLCQAYARQWGARYVAAIPADVFGPGDEFSAEDAHVVPALIRRMHEAKAAGAATVDVWGTGAPRREFLFVDDLAAACLLIMDSYDGPAPINLGGGDDLSIAEAAARIKAVVGFAGTLRFDPGKPDGMPAKILDSRRLQALGWHRATPFDHALRMTYAWFLAQGEPVPSFSSPAEG